MTHHATDQILLAYSDLLKNKTFSGGLVVLRINVDLVIFQPYLDLEAGDNQSLKISSGEAGNRTPVLLLRHPKSVTTRPALLPRLFLEVSFFIKALNAYVQHMNALKNKLRLSESRLIFTLS